MKAAIGVGVGQRTVKPETPRTLAARPALQAAWTRAGQGVQGNNEVNRIVGFAVARF